MKLNKVFGFILFIITFINLNIFPFENQSKKRIVSLGPTATEILFAIGAENQIVARTDICDYPPEVKKIKSVGGFDGKSISLEAIISFEPDFVYLFSGMHNHLIQPLKNFGIDVYVSNAVSIEQIKKEILEVGKIIGNYEQAKKVVLHMEEKLSRIEKKVLENRKKFNIIPKVYWEVWNSPLMSIGNKSFINDLIERAGAVNIFSLENSAYPIVTEESIIMAKPDFVFYTSEEQLDRIQKGDSGIHSNWPEPSCGYFNVGGRDIFSRSSPRCVLALEELVDLIWQQVEK